MDKLQKIGHYYFSEDLPFRRERFSENMESSPVHLANQLTGYLGKR